MTAIEQHVLKGGTHVDAYRTGFVWMTHVVNLLGIGVFFFLALLLYVVTTHTPPDRYYAELYDGKKQPMVGLDMPNINQQTLFDWASEAATQIMTFGFNDYERKLSATRLRFTQKGWESFRTAMIDTDFFKGVLESRQIVTSVVKGPPTLLSEGVEKGQYYWMVELPLMLTVRSGSASRSTSQTAFLRIVPVPTAEIPNGIGIDLWTMR